jgi:hypothetical protein
VKKFIAIILIIIGIAIAFGSIIQSSVEKTIIGHANSGALWTTGIIGVIILIVGIIVLNRK